MGLTIYHLNIRNFNKFQYNLTIDLNSYSPDIILLNETGLEPLFNPRLLGYQSISKSQGLYSGVAIFIKNDLTFELIRADDDNSLGIKLITNMGPIIIGTNYCAPRFNYIPTPTLKSFLSHNLPTILISDFNAHHPNFSNSIKGQPNGDATGKILNKFIQSNNLNFLGPYFHTYISNKKRGKPDLILSNNKFKLYHYYIQPGEFIGSDHVPIIMKISINPIKIPIIPRFL